MQNRILCLDNCQLNISSLKDFSIQALKHFSIRIFDVIPKENTQVHFGSFMRFEEDDHSTTERQISSIWLFIIIIYNRIFYCGSLLSFMEEDNNLTMQ